MAKHYLTFTGLTSCTVNGQAVASGYELKDGDVIVATYSSLSTAGYYFNVNGVVYKNTNTLDITNDDINIGLHSEGGSN